MLLQNDGLTHHDIGRATDGLTLFSTVNSQQVRLIDLDGKQVHGWQVQGGCSNPCLMLPNGNLWICERSPEAELISAGAGGLIREYDWTGRIVWEHHDPRQHHDARRLPNGGAVFPVWRRLTDTETAQVKGGLEGSEYDDGKIYCDVIREVDASGEIVWEWDTAVLIPKFSIHHNAPRKGYGHANAVDVLSNGDYLISFKRLNLLVIVSRATKQVTWALQDVRMGGQHDAQATDKGTILVFGNGLYAHDLHHSCIWEIDPKTSKLLWSYTAKRNHLSFYSPHMSGCQRLRSGNTLICEAAKGCLFEVTPERDVVWEYVNPYWHEDEQGQIYNWVYRARRYERGGPEIRLRC